MSVFARLFKVGQAKANRLVDGLEKPEEMLDQAIRDKEKQIAEAKRAVQSCIATERQMKAQLDKEKNDQLEWEKKAELALKAGKEDLAAKALGRSAENEKNALSLQGTWEKQKEEVDKLKKTILDMENEIAEYRRNKDFIIAQSKAAQVKKQVYEAKAKMSKNRSADDLMARMKAKAERSSYEAEAAEEMADLSGGDSLEKEFKDLGDSQVDAGVQAKLDALKKKLDK